MTADRIAVATASAHLAISRWGYSAGILSALQQAERQITDSVDALEAVGYRVVKDEPDHFVTFADDLWFVEHSLDCRIAGTIGTCRYNDAVRRITDVDGIDYYGRWLITGLNDEGLPSLEWSGPS